MQLQINKKKKKKKKKRRKKQNKKRTHMFGIWVLYVTVKYIMSITMMKESKGANGDLEPEHKKTTQTLIHVVRGQPSEPSETD